MKKRIHQIELFMKYPHEVQDEVLKRLLGVAINTEFGQKYSFEDIVNYDAVSYTHLTLPTILRV